MFRQESSAALISCELTFVWNKITSVLLASFLNTLKRNGSKEHRGTSTCDTAPNSIHHTAVDLHTLTSECVSWHQLRIPLEESISGQGL